MILASVAVLSLIWARGSADNPGVSWPSNADDAFDPINWWKEVNFAVCNSTVPCAAGLVCNNYPPCQQSWCDACADPYLPVVTYNDDEYTFTCVLPTKKIGDSCSQNTDCYDDASMCTSGRCQCAAGMNATSDNMACTSSGYIQLGAACNSSFQCGNNAQCGDNRTGGNCQCYYNYVSFDNINCVGFQPGNNCSSTDCSSADDCPGASCSTGSYQCNPGYLWVNTTQTGSLCVFTNASMSLTAGQSCSYEAPYNQICGNGLSCDQCPENTGYSCQNAAPTPVATASGNSTSTSSPITTTTVKSGSSVTRASSVTLLLVVALLMMLA